MPGSAAIDAVVVNFNGGEMLAQCVESLANCLDNDAVICVVDNRSEDGSAEAIAVKERVRLVQLDANRGFGAGLNAGLAATTAPWILSLNNDATIAADALDALGAACESGDDVGALALRMRFAHRPELINSAGISVDRRGVAHDRLLGEPAAGPALRAGEVFGASGGAAVYRRSMLESIGGFDESFFLYLEDVDVAWRAQMAGWRTLYVPDAVATHRHSATSIHGSPNKYFYVGRNRLRLLAKNMPRRQLIISAPGILLEEAAYVGFVAARDRTLAPLQGRLAGLREWRSYRASGSAARTELPLAPPAGLISALRRRAAWRRGGTGLA
jgi:GT2 family glycosyltransferase